MQARDAALGCGVVCAQLQNSSASEMLVSVRVQAR